MDFDFQYDMYENAVFDVLLISHSYTVSCHIVSFLAVVGVENDVVVPVTFPLSHSTKIPLPSRGDCVNNQTSPLTLDIASFVRDALFFTYAQYLYARTYALDYLSFILRRGHATYRVCRAQSCL